LASVIVTQTPKHCCCGFNAESLRWSQLTLIALREED
jgi:hypothetical protein